MRLRPYPNVELRWRKVCKHVFEHRERWWEVYGDLQSWQRDWTTVRAAGALPTQDGHLALHAADAARAVVEAHHARWLEAAERAVDQAVMRAKDRVARQGQRTRYRGENGVLVVLVGDALVTCFRVEAALGPRGSGRAAVRRARRRASLSGRGPEEHDVGD